MILSRRSGDQTIPNGSDDPVKWDTQVSKGSILYSDGLLRLPKSGLYAVKGSVTIRSDENLTTPAGSNVAFGVRTVNPLGALPSFEDAFSYYRVEAATGDVQGTGNITLAFSAEIHADAGQVMEFALRGITASAPSSIVVVSTAGNADGNFDCTFASVRLICKDAVQAQPRTRPAGASEDDL